MKLADCKNSLRDKEMDPHRYSNDKNVKCDIISYDWKNNMTTNNIFNNDDNVNRNNKSTNTLNNTDSTISLKKLNRPFDLILW